MLSSAAYLTSAFPDRGQPTLVTPGDVCLALIGDGPVLFKGTTPLSVRKSAEEWRLKEMEKLRAKTPNMGRDK